MAMSRPSAAAVSILSSLSDSDLVVRAIPASLEREGVEVAGPKSPAPPSGLGEVGDDAAAGLVAALECGFADDVEFLGVAGLRQRFLLPLAQPQDAPQRGIDDGDLAAAHVAARHGRQRAEIRHVAVDRADDRGHLALGLLVLGGDT